MCNQDCCWVEEYLSYAQAKVAIPLTDALPSKEDPPDATLEDGYLWDDLGTLKGICTRCVGTA